jgi:hypothetical protein
MKMLEIPMCVNMTHMLVGMVWACGGAGQDSSKFLMGMTV